MHPSAKHYKCAGVTVKGKPCGNGESCPVHRKDNAARRRREDDAHLRAIIARNKKQDRQAIKPNLFSRERIQQLIEEGKRENLSYGC